MKSSFLIGVLAGLLLTFAGAYFAPWGEHARLPSHTAVQANGGRVEQFIVRLPADRLAGHGAGFGRMTFPGASGDDPGASGDEPSANELSANELTADHFKLRDTQGNVIGVAARHSASAGDGPIAIWSVVIPSRGTFVLTGDATDSALRSTLERNGYRSGSSWNGDVRLQRSGDSGRLALGREEFEAMQGTFSESWHVTGVDESGELRGTVELTMLTFRGA